MNFLYRTFPGLLDWNNVNQYKLGVLHGDILEVMLAFARLAGEKVDDHHKKDRRKFVMAVQTFTSKLAMVIQLLDRDKIPIRKQMKMKDLVQAIMEAIHHHYAAASDGCPSRGVIQSEIMGDTKAESRPTGFFFKQDLEDQPIPLQKDLRTAAQARPPSFSSSRTSSVYSITHPKNDYAPWNVESTSKKEERWQRTLEGYELAMGPAQSREDSGTKIDSKREGPYTLQGRKTPGVRDSSVSR